MKKKGETQKIGLYLGGAQKDAISEARAAINDILKSSCDQSTKVEALKTLKDLCQQGGAMIPMLSSHCGFRRGT